jgi:murein L,D-transpeptidase YcbB/YkuD
MRATLRALAVVLNAAFISGSAWAVDIEILTPPEKSDVQGGPSVPPAAPIETGSIEHAITPVPPVIAAVSRGVRDLIEAEVSAEAVKAPPPDPANGAAGDAPAVRPRSSEERDLDALKRFYEGRSDAPLWVSEKGLNARAKLVIELFGRAGDWGLDASQFEVPKLKLETEPGADPAPADLSAAEFKLSVAAMKYARYARGAAINDAPKDLSSYLDRRPLVRDRDKLLTELAAADDPAAYLEGIHPKHAQFELLRKAWLEARGGGGNKGNPAKADQLLANMQQWRWMPEDLGQMYVWVNVPEFQIRIVNNGEVVFNERITVGLVNKQTPIFSDQMERVTFKSKWIVPDSIKVREVWPSLMRGGGLMRQHGLRMMNEAGEDVDWRKIDWSKTAMKDYTIYQPPGPRNQLGLVKFSFPSKHYVFMHDTPDKHMFAWTRRANSHGCMRIRNPLQMATVILGADKGWDRAKINDLVKNGPDHNVIELDKKIPVHITYFTARVEENGKITTFGDIYGHEKRVRQALAGQWDKIAKGPDHLAPVDQESIPRIATLAKKRALPDQTSGGLMGAIFGGGF